MVQKRTIPFVISGMDSLGQGVCKTSDKITFIAKTLPGDEGEAEIISEKKGVRFAQVSRLITPSNLRREPLCPHFASCPSCHYLHTSYENELNFKLMAFERMFQKIPHAPIETIGATSRLNYRNRIQLHYDNHQQKLGMFDAKRQTIIEVPLCEIGNSAVTKTLRQLYENRSWLKHTKSLAPTGHVEIYDSNEGLRISWNRPYAEGGFTQVFAEMNEKLKLTLQLKLKNLSIGALLDLFAGNGNLSENLNHSRRLCVDIYPTEVSYPFFSQDLYAPQALNRVQQILFQNQIQPDTLLIDPPRSGMKDLYLWLEKLKPKNVIYVSCDPHTLTRDISMLKNYAITSLVMLDFFPSTFHFESLVILERK